MKRTDIILKKRARNTKENASYTLELIGDSLLTQPVLLITSAYHMKRSLLSAHSVLRPIVVAVS